MNLALKWESDLGEANSRIGHLTHDVLDLNAEIARLREEIKRKDAALQEMAMAIIDLNKLVIAMDEK